MPLDKESKTVICINQGCGKMEKIKPSGIKSWVLLPVDTDDQLTVGGTCFAVSLFRCYNCGYVELYDFDSDHSINT